MRCCGMTFSKYTCSVLLILLALTSGTSIGHASSDGQCYDDWSEAGPVVRKEALMPVTDVLRKVKRERSGKVVKVRLCKRAEDYFYKVALAGRGGAISWLLLDASTGRIQPLVRP